MAKSGKRRKTYRHWYLRDWRKDRGLTLEQLANRVGSTAASISRYEKGEQPYSQPILEALADALSCAPADLIMRPPGSSDRLMAVFSDLDPETQKQAMAVIKALSGKAA
jgi:transcriptional regulator with XRE-family HTH domain